MTPRTLVGRLTRLERLNFLLTNRIPRRWATLFMGWFSQIRYPWVRRPSIAIWQFFAGDLALHEARKQHFDSMQDCFIRQLRPGARPVDPDPRRLVSPCDGEVGAHGPIRGTEVFQAKGYPYSLEELLGDAEMAERYRDGVFVTLRLRASMYHRFHAPADCRLEGVTYIPGDTWNVNPVALRRVDRLFCRNERATLELDLDDHGPNIALVPVAAILVASLRLHCLSDALDLRYCGPRYQSCAASYQRGEELGYFQQGSTIIVLGERGWALSEGVAEGVTLRMGQPLLARVP